MEDKNKVPSPEFGQSLWISPGDVFSSTKDSVMMSTPNPSVWPSLTQRLDDSVGSSKQDSGYYTQTPSSGESFDGTSCQFCNKKTRQNYAQSTPICNICCKNKYYEQTLSSDHLEMITETKISPAQSFLPRVITRPINLYDEVMDTSLYPDEMEVDTSISGEANHFASGLLEIDEEKSIDFIENGLGFLSEKPTDTNKFKEVTDRSREIIEIKHHTEKLFHNEEKINCSKVSPKVNNETTPVKARCGTFQTAAKKVNKLNKVVKLFKLTGIERIDFFYHLVVKRSYPHIVSQILSYLSEKDLESVRVVSKTWNEVLYQDFKACNRWKLRKTVMAMKKENLTSPTKTGRPRQDPLSPLHAFNNQRSPEPRPVAYSPRRTPPVSPNSARFYSFQRAAKTLKKGDRLLPCPKCYFPSHDYGSPTVQCSRSGCRHRFCVWCRNEATPSGRHQCPPLYTPRTPRRSAHKMAPVGSKSCKRNLRRL